MALEAFLDFNNIPMIFSGNGEEGISKALISNSTFKNEEYLGSDVLSSTFVGRSSTSRFGVGNDAAANAVTNLTLPDGTYLQSHCNTALEPYSSSPMSFSSDNPVIVSDNGEIFSHLCQAREKESRKHKSENAIGSTNLFNTKGQNSNSVGVRTEQELGILAPFLKRPRHDVNQQQRSIIQELLLKELQDCNPQLRAMMSQQSQLQQQILQPATQRRGFHLQLSKQLPKQVRCLLHDQGNQQETFAPLLDGGICSRRLKQYLYHQRNNRHDNDINYWKKFVSEYYAPDSKKRWCFSKYKNIELHTTGVFCPKSSETYCCQICGQKSGKGLEATSEIFPRLFKMKYESGMVDEILYIDSPRAYKVPYGLVLEYGKAIQESVYETFRVVHNGKLRVVFRHDLKILSWEFCIQNHEEYMLQALFNPQVKQLVQEVEMYQDIQNSVSSRASLLDLRKVCNMFVSTGIQIMKSMELPLVNDLGYPKQFIRCLQIAEVVDSMKDLMAHCQDTTMGAIECLNSYSQGRKKVHNQMKRNQGIILRGDDQNSPDRGFHANGCLTTENGAISGLEISGSSVLGYKSSTTCTRMDRSNQATAFVQSFSSHFQKEASSVRSQSPECSQASHQALMDKMFHEMLAANSAE